MRTLNMMIVCLVLFVMVGRPGTIIAQDNCAPLQDRFLMVGDSWYAIMYGTNSYAYAFDKFGFSDMSHTAAAPAINGATLELSVENLTLNFIEQTLIDNPQVDLVGISLGGNDLLGRWGVDMWTPEENAFFSELRGYIYTLVDRIQAVRPGIHVFWSGYDYPNFVETTLYFGSPYHATWENMGEPSVLELNMALARMEQLKIDLLHLNPQVHYVHSMGLMQYIYGYPIGLPVPPYFPFDPGLVPYPGQLSDDFQPYPGGLANYPSPLVALNWDGLDGIHFTPEAYQHLADHQTRSFFFDHFRDYPEATYATDASAGWVSSNGGIGTDRLRSGELAQGVEYRSILSFNTADIPDDAQIEKASIFLTRSGLTGYNPFGNDIGNNFLDIIDGSFGAPGLESGDFDAAASLTDVGCFVGSASEDGYKIRIDISADALNEINKTGITQFRVGFDNSTQFIDALMDFTSGGEHAPILDVHYSSPTAINDAMGLDPASISVYPNPSNGWVNIVWNNQSLVDRSIKVYDDLGRIVKDMSSTGGALDQLDLRELATANYFVQVSTSQGTITKKIFLFNE